MRGRNPPDEGPRGICAEVTSDLRPGMREKCTEQRKNINECPENTVGISLVTGPG